MRQEAKIAFDLYVETARRCDLTIPRPTDKLLKAITARLREFDGIEGWKRMLAIVEASPFLRGQIIEFSANIHWLTKNSENINKVLCGNYDKRSRPRSSPGGGVF